MQIHKTYRKGLRSCKFWQWISWKLWWKWRKLPSNSKLCMGFRLTYLHFKRCPILKIIVMDSLTIIHWKYWNEKKLLMTSNTKLYMGFRLAYLTLTLKYFKDQGQGHAHFDREYQGNGDTVKNYHYNKIVRHVSAFDQFWRPWSRSCRFL